MHGKSKRFLAGSVMRSEVVFDALSVLKLALGFVCARESRMTRAC